MRKKAVSRKPTQAALAKEYGVSGKTVTIWKQAGVDIYDPEEVRRYVANLQSPAASWQDKETGSIDDTTPPATYQEARIRKIQKETEKLTLQVQKERGELVPVSQVRQEALRAAAAMKAALLRLESDLPPALEGLSAAEMQKVIREKIDTTLLTLTDVQGELYQTDGSPTDH